MSSPLYTHRRPDSDHPGASRTGASVFVSIGERDGGTRCRPADWTNWTHVVRGRSARSERCSVGISGQPRHHLSTLSDRSAGQWRRASAQFRRNCRPVGCWRVEAASLCRFRTSRRRLTGRVGAAAVDDCISRRRPVWPSRRPLYDLSSTAVVVRSRAHCGPVGRGPFGGLWPTMRTLLTRGDGGAGRRPREPFGLIASGRWLAGRPGACLLIGRTNTRAPVQRPSGGGIVSRRPAYSDALSPPFFGLLPCDDALILSAILHLSLLNATTNVRRARA